MKGDGDGDGGLSVRRSAVLLVVALRFFDTVFGGYTLLVFKVGDPYGSSGGGGGGGVPLGSGGMSAAGTAGLSEGDELEGLSLSSVSSTLASFFLFLAILR